MTSSTQLARRLMTAGVTTFLSVLVSAQTSPPKHVVDTHFPVGRWVAENPSKGGIGSWWEFRADGTLTMHFGVMVNDHIDRSGDTFMESSGMAGGERVRARYTISNGVLSIDTGASQPTTYSRIGTPPNPADPLIGSWRPLPRTADVGGDPNFSKNYAIMQQVMSTKGLLIFTPDGMQYLRVPLGTRDGTWDDHANSFRIQDDPVSYAFGRMNSKLVLGQMPNGRDMDSYVLDPLPPVTGSIAPVAKANQESGTTEASGVFRQEPGIVMPKVTHFVEPSYTDEARKRKIRGTVRVEVVVEADGHLRTPQVLKSAADADSDPRDRDAAQTLDQKAIEAVSQYSFVPGTFHDKPVPIAVTVEVLLPDALIVPEGESGAVQRGEYSVCNEMDCWNHRGNHRPDRRILRGRIPVLRLVMAE
jgi:TonB family protein